MPSPNAAWNDIAVTTLKKRRRKLADNFTSHNALLRRLREQYNMSTVDGGETLVEELEYQGNTTFMYYAGYEVFNMTPQELFTAAEYDWKQAAVMVTASGLELRKNSGESRSIPLLAKRIKNAEKTLLENLAAGIYSDGTGFAGKEIGGTQLLVADNPAVGTVGGIPRASFTFWRNFTDTNTQTAANIQADMDAMWLNLVRGMDHPDLIVADAIMFNYYWQSLQAIQRINEVAKGAAGYRGLEFNGPGGTAAVLFDDRCPTKHMYMLNTEFFYWKAHKDANFEVLDEVRSINQDAIAVPVIFMGNLTLSNASLQGVIIDD